MVATSKKNTISPRQKRILQLLFSLVETIIEIRKNPIFQNVMFFWLSTDSIAFFLLMENIIEIRRNPVLQKKFLRWIGFSCRWTTDFLASGSRFVSRFFLLVETVTESSGSQERAHLN